MRYFRYTDFGFPDSYAIVIDANEGWLAQNPDRAAKFVQALQRGYQFAADNPDGASFERRAKDWLRSRGLVPINVAYSGDDMPLMFRSVKSMNPGVYYLLGGRSRTGVNHTVVCLDDAIVHDPSPTEAGVVGPCDDGFYWLTFFGTAAAVRAA